MFAKAEQRTTPTITQLKELGAHQVADVVSRWQKLQETQSNTPTEELRRLTHLALLIPQAILALPDLYMFGFNFIQELKAKLANEETLHPQN